LSLSELGLVNDELRKQAWPILLGIEKIKTDSYEWLGKFIHVK